MKYINDVLQPEDIGLVESVQRGLHSRGYRQAASSSTRTAPSERARRAPLHGWCWRRWERCAIAVMT